MTGACLNPSGQEWIQLKLYYIVTFGKISYGLERGSGQTSMQLKLYAPVITCHIY